MQHRVTGRAEVHVMVSTPNGPQTHRVGVDLKHAGSSGGVGLQRTAASPGGGIGHA